jgi:hypothetical protein
MFDLRFLIFDWQAAPVPPRTSWVLETRLRKLALGLWSKMTNLR